MAPCTVDESFEIAQELLDSSSMDPLETIFKGIETYKKMVHALTNRCRGLADLLDAQDAQHAEEMETLKRGHEATLNEMKEQINEHLTSLNNLHNENRSKEAVCERFTDALQHIQKRKFHIHIDTCAFCCFFFHFRLKKFFEFLHISCI